ncbi:MAG: zinc-dependent alcohol dehydrogenase family protein [Alphaproteobacteria bacterium]|nr:zinc-dependent alcohol dehydrogenase family protein [Alphaproteobacteria bacterium]
MKIVRFHEFGGPDVLRVENVPDPVPGPGEIRVRSEAIGVGVPDILMRRGNYEWIPPLPVVPGNELAGTVDAIGDGVETIAVGDRVYVNSRELPHRGGGYAEAMVVPAASVFAMPDNVDAAQAVALGNYQLAWLLLNYASTPRAGDRILVHAAAGGVGSALVQVAKSMGLEVFGIAGSKAKAEYVTEQGADAVIDRNAEDVGARVADLTGGEGVDFIYDSVAGPGLSNDFAMLAPMGTVVMFGYLGGDPDPDLFAHMRAKFGDSIAFRLFSIHVLDNKPVIRRGAMKSAMAALAAGDISPHIHTTMPLAEAADAHRLVEGGSVTGKVVLTP